jgi:hypothetical protein
MVNKVKDRCNQVILSPNHKTAGDSTKSRLNLLADIEGLIEESNRECTDPGMLLSCSFKPDLSHTSILYYYYNTLQNYLNLAKKSQIEIVRL